MESEQGVPPQEQLLLKLFRSLTPSDQVHVVDVLGAMAKRSGRSPSTLNDGVYRGHQE